MVSLICVVAGMLMLSYAAVPLYSLFCQITGYGGTPAQLTDAEMSKMVVLDREILVDFNTDTDPSLEWTFKPLQRKINVPIGKRVLAFFEAKNNANIPIVGTATFNVTPFKAGGYFVKTQCFCFERQRIEAGQTMHFPVSFYIDPELDKEENLDDITNMTLSYTFFPVKE